MNICVFGASATKLDRQYYDKAYEFGALLAEHGHTLVFGAGCTGLMGAAFQGAESRGGYTVGIAPRFFDEPGILCKNCSELIFTDTMNERKELMNSRSDAFAVLPGGIGTFEEFFEMLTLRQLGRHDKPIALLNTAGYFNELVAMMRRAENEKFLGDGCMELFSCADTPDELMHSLETEAALPRVRRSVNAYTK